VISGGAHLTARQGEALAVLACGQRGAQV